MSARQASVDRKTLETAINQAKAGILPARLRLEITETDAMLRADAAAASDLGDLRYRDSPSSWGRHRSPNSRAMQERAPCSCQARAQTFVCSPQT